MRLLLISFAVIMLTGCVVEPVNLQYMDRYEQEEEGE